MATATFILFDTETTGNQEEDRVIQVGAIVADTKDRMEVIDEMCSSSVPIKIEAMEVHNITPEMIEGKPSYSETHFKKVLDECNSPENYLIAHNINFDLDMIKKEGFDPRIRLIDTLRVSKHLIKDASSHRLQFLRYFLELYKEEEKEAGQLNITIKAHDAIGDVLIMKLLFARLIKMAKEAYPDANPIATLVSLTQTPVLIEKFKFGKYKDRVITEVAKEDLGYLRWMKTNMDLDEDMLFTLSQIEGV